MKSSQNQGLFYMQLGFQSLRTILYGVSVCDELPKYTYRKNKYEIFIFGSFLLISYYQFH